MTARRSIAGAFLFALSALVVSPSALAEDDEPADSESEPASESPAAAKESAAPGECSGWFCDDAPKASVPAPGEGTVTIPGLDGLGKDVLSGTITEVVPGDHVTIKLPSGETKTLAWGTLLQLQISGKIVIGGGSTAASPPPAPPPATVIIAPPPPAKHAPPPPPAAVYAPPPSDAYASTTTPSSRGFRERWALGVRLNFLSPGENSSLVKGTHNGLRDFVGSGTGLELALGYRVSPSWTPYGFFEYARFKNGTINHDVDDRVSSAQVGLGIHANTNPDGLGFLFDIGIGYRWLTVPYGSGQLSSLDSGAGNVPTGPGKATYGGVTAMRLGLGLSIASSKHVRWDLMAQGSFGSFSMRKDSNNVCVAGGTGKGEACETIPEDKRGAHAFLGVSLGALFDL